ncbi:unnamed protein product [Rotaria magnacalcarata]|uniref:Uncharacterized protein n=1 Tax=Rotaria magnacalcarata TaxID=392030 RepID=A0A814LX04_9BILA|nr:unnamed protein product [Rotaria magnacalcarata]
MPTSTQAVAPYAPRLYQGLAEETNDVSYTPNQTTVREVQWNMANLPSANSLESAATTSWKPLIIVLAAVILVAAVAAVATPFLIAYFKTGKCPSSNSNGLFYKKTLLQHQQQVQQLLLQHQRRQPLQLQPQPQQLHQRRQQQPQRRPLPLRHLRPQPLRQRQLQQVSVSILITCVLPLFLAAILMCVRPVPVGNLISTTYIKSQFILYLVGPLCSALKRAIFEVVIIACDWAQSYMRSFYYILS